MYCDSGIGITRRESRETFGVLALVIAVVVLAIGGIVGSLILHDGLSATATPTSTGGVSLRGNAHKLSIPASAKAAEKSAASVARRFLQDARRHFRRPLRGVAMATTDDAQKAGPRHVPEAARSSPNRNARIERLGEIFLDHRGMASVSRVCPPLPRNGGGPARHLEAGPVYSPQSPSLSPAGAHGHAAAQSQGARGPEEEKDENNFLDAPAAIPRQAQTTSIEASANWNSEAAREAFTAREPRKPKCYSADGDDQPAMRHLFLAVFLSLTAAGAFAHGRPGSTLAHHHLGKPHGRFRLKDRDGKTNRGEIGSEHRSLSRLGRAEFRQRGYRERPSGGEKTVFLINFHLGGFAVRRSLIETAVGLTEVMMPPM